MTRAALPFALPQASGLSELGGAQAFAANVMVDKNGVITRRPGLVAPSSLYAGEVDPDGLSGLVVTSSDSVYAIGAGDAVKRIYKVSGGVQELSASGVRVAGAGRAVVAETEAMLVITAGREPVKCLFSDGSVSLLSGAMPSSHIIAQNSRLLTNDIESRGLIWFSGQALGSSITGHETWNNGLTSGFFSHEARPDPLLALHENTNEVFGFGSTSLQVWSPDSSVFYSPASTREYGLGAVYSVIKREQSFYFLDDRRRFVACDGRSAEDVSKEIQQTLNDLGTVSDCWGFWYHEGIADCLVWVFPTEKRAFAFQVGRGWNEWLGFSGSNWSTLNLGCAAERSYRGQRLVGTLDGKVATLTRSASTDLGETIVAEITTGFVNNGTDSLKHCLAVLVNLRRSGQGSARPVAWLSYRDGPNETWRRVAIRLGGTNESLSVVRLPGFGTYRRRQWRFEFSESDLELVSVEEEFTISEV